MEKIGIIGFGAFGQLLANTLAPHAKVRVFDKTKTKIPSAIRVSSISQLSDAQIIIIATPLESINSICQEIAVFVSDKTIVMDVCSVKVIPQKIIKEVLGDKCRVIATHPLFGPQSVQQNKGVQGLKMVICRDDIQNFPEITDLFRDILGIQLISMSAENHDAEMAWVHGLTFLVGRSLMNMGPPKSPLATNYYTKLLDLVDLEKEHSSELFMTIQRGNTHTTAIRKQFINEISTLDKVISQGEKL